MINEMRGRMGKRGIVKILLVFFCVLSISLGNYSDKSIIAKEDNEKNRYNVIFVTDESGSMKTTDPEGLRYEAVLRFVGLTAQEGNYLGSISFSDNIASKNSIKLTEGFKEKEDLVNKISRVNTVGSTNIGLALQKAIEDLNENRNKELPSVIILLTDGNTDMSNDDLQEESINMKADAIEEARKKGYAIYTICLNVDGSADVTEMQQIANATGGKFTEISKAEDLMDVQTMYYNIIFRGIENNQDGKIEFDDKGMAEKTFNVPDIGVEELNIILEGEFLNYKVIDPNKKIYSESDLKEVTMVGNDFTLVKLTNPEGGQWKVVLHGKPGAAIDFKLLFNTFFSIDTSIAPDSNYSVGQNVKFVAKVKDMHGLVEDSSQYVNFNGVVHVSHNGEESELPMKADGNSLTYSYRIPDDGTFYIYITVSDGELEATSNTYEISVENRAPIPPDSEPSAHANLWPFIGGEAIIDLKDIASDPDNEELTFTIESTAFNDVDYSLDGTILRVINFSIPKGSFTIKAMDSHGAFCTFDVLVTSTNIGLIMVISIAVGVMIVLIALGILIYKRKFIPFMGTITVEKFDNNNDGYDLPVSINPGRGSVYLESIMVGCDLPRRCKFQAGGKNGKIYFKSKKPVYCDLVNKAVRKIEIDGMNTKVIISMDENLNHGIKVSFDSMIRNELF